MGDHTRHCVSRPELRERIIETAVDAFTTHGIRGITMDDIAASLSISKRTLYEVFADKESLLEACVLRKRAQTDEFLKELLATADNVMEVLLRCYQRTVEHFHATNKRFFEDIRKYPRAYELMCTDEHRNSEDIVKFFKEGVRQGLFRDDVHFEIVSLLVHEQLNLLLSTDICAKYSFPEVYESIMFTFLRGISTEKGAAELERFIRNSRKHSN